MTGGGHSPEQVMLYSADDNLILGGDQILAKISPNVSVEAMEPDGDPLGLYLRSLERLKRDAARGRRSSCRATTCRSSACAPAPTSSSPITRRAAWRSSRPAGPAPQTVAELVPVIFGRADRRSAPARLRLRRGAGACQHDDPRRPPARRARRARARARGGVTRRSRGRAQQERDLTAIGRPWEIAMGSVSVAHVIRVTA